MTSRYTGRVKWFNNKAGYGFVTVTDGAKSGTDVFVHHSGINVDNDQYKYLVQGEYVDFEFIDAEGSSHEFQAGNVTGIKGGKLMCESRYDSRASRIQYRKEQPLQTQPPQQSSHTQPPQPREKQVKPREKQQKDGGEWTYVGNSKTPEQKKRGRPPSKKSEQKK